MGIKNLNKVLEKYAPEAIIKIKNKDLENKIIAIDTSLVMHQILVAIDSHIFAIISKTLSYLKKKIIPVFVFDGIPPELKDLTLDKRKKTKAAVELKIISATEEEMEKLKKRTISFSRKQADECKEILKLMGIPFIEAPSEADAQCAYLSKEGIVDYVLSEDMDLLTFGTKKLIRGLTNNKTCIYDLNIILEKLELSQSEFIDMCILLGCDYSNTIEGIGMVKAFQFIKKYKTIEEIIKKEKKYTLPAKFKHIQARQFFNNPPVTTNFNIKISTPNISKLTEKLIEYEFSQKTIDNVVAVLTNQKIKVNSEFID